MAKLFQANEWTNGAFSVVDHPTKGISTKAGKSGSTFGTMDASNADTALGLVIKFADELDRPVCRWSVYVAGVNEKLGDAKTVRHIPVKALKKALKDGFIATVEMGKYSQARITLRNPAGDPTAPRTSVSTVLA
jgi:hypothetical protein